MTITTVIAPESAVFTAADRCDRCGAQAHIRATFTTGDLLFCQHHGREYASDMAHTAVRIVGDLGLAL